MAAWKKFIERAVQSNPSTVAKRRWALLARERGTIPTSIHPSSQRVLHRQWLQLTPCVVTWLVGSQAAVLHDLCPQGLRELDPENGPGRPVLDSTVPCRCRGRRAAQGGRLPNPLCRVWWYCVHPVAGGSSST